MNKTRKSIAKRLIKTGGGKILHRTCGQNHFNSRESGKTTKNKRKNRELSKNFRKTIKQL
ncbi:MAG: 50S ribosomal protein L35 [Patescibacteria group bacterium]|jgi:ribosomal protein L35|nr:50S ribosomal protein L35 [Patescibacteria group bacterium]MDD5172626.1 50S ribosomal protein L35 [Patescibacteria group bacterium]